jgi:hypothetical protein
MGIAFHVMEMIGNRAFSGKGKLDLIIILPKVFI